MPPSVLLISNDAALRQQILEAIMPATSSVVGVPNTRDILTQRSPRQVSGYDLIVAEVDSTDHDGLSRLILFRNLYPNTPLLVVTREAEAESARFDQAAARALNAWLVRLDQGSFGELSRTAARVLNGEDPRQTNT